MRHTSWQHLKLKAISNIPHCVSKCPFVLDHTIYWCETANNKYLPASLSLINTYYWHAAKQVHRLYRIIWQRNCWVIMSVRTMNIIITIYPHFTHSTYSSSQYTRTLHILLTHETRALLAKSCLVVCNNDIDLSLVSDNWTIYCTQLVRYTYSFYTV